MSETKPLLLNQSNMTARIDNTRFTNGVHYTHVTTPASDQYSQPSSFILRSQSPLGNVGDLIKVRVIVSGYIRKFSYTDKKTGEIKNGFESNVYFDIVD